MFDTRPIERRDRQVLLSLLLASLAATASFGFSRDVAAADLKAGFTPVPCPATVVTEPPPCQDFNPGVKCTAPGRYYFKSNAGLGCAGIVSEISVILVRGPDQYGRIATKYSVEYSLYTGNGFQDDDAHFHIDALVRGGYVVRDIVAPIQLYLSDCLYQITTFDIPPPGTLKHPETPFDYTQYPILNIFIRVEDARSAGKNSHC